MRELIFKVKDHTISHYGTCRKCGWAVIFACCNDGFDKNMDKAWDWACYCSNKGCDNHEAEGIWQSGPPEWVNNKDITE